MAKVVQIHAQGGPEVLQIEDLEVGEPGPGRGARPGRGGRPQPLRGDVSAPAATRSPLQLPSRIGYEGVGTIEALGPGVEGFALGERVCVLPMTSQGEYGMWAEQAIVPARVLLPAPPGLSPAEAASIWMQYMTAYAIIEVANVGIGDGVIIRAASSSVGLAAIQLANWAGSISIACTRTPRQGRRAARAGRGARDRHRGRGPRRAGDGDHRRQGRAHRIRSGRRALCRHARPGACAARHPVHLRRAERRSRRPIRTGPAR